MRLGFGKRMAEILMQLYGSACVVLASAGAGPEPGWLGDLHARKMQAKQHMRIECNNRKADH